MKRKYIAFNALDGSYLESSSRKALNNAVKITEGRWYFDNYTNTRFTKDFCEDKKARWKAEGEKAQQRWLKWRRAYFKQNTRDC